LSNARKPTINKTLAANQFNTQGNMDLLEAKASNIYLGYVLNNTSGNIDEIAFAYPNTDGVIAWTINVEKQIAQKTMDIDVVPFIGKRGPDKTDRLKPKRPAANKTAKQ